MTGPDNEGTTDGVSRAEGPDEMVASRLENTTRKEFEHHRSTTSTTSPPRATSTPQEAATAFFDTPTIHVMIVLTSLARTSGGGFSFAQGLLSALVGRVHITLVLPDTAVGLQIDTGEHQIRVINVRSRKGFARIIRDIAWTGYWAKKFGADVVVIPHEWAAPVKGIPVVNIVQNVLYLHPGGRRAHPVKALIMSQAAKRTAQFAARTVALSPTAAQLWQDATGHPAIVIPGGVVEAFRSAAVYPRENHVVVVTGPATYKNPKLAAAIVKELRTSVKIVSITIVGMPATMLEHKGNVTVHQYLKPQELVSLFGRARVVVVTSGLESFGLPAFEALSAGARVVVVKGTAMDEWLGRDPAVVSAQPTVTSLVAAVHQAWADPSIPRGFELTGFEWAALGAPWAEALTSVSDQAGARVK